MRKSGILMPVSSLPSPYGIGCFSGEAYEFVDQLAEAGQKYWQILPLGPTGYGDSPYQSFSAFAGNPYFIDLDTLEREGLLKKEEYIDISTAENDGTVDYGKIYSSRFTILKTAYERAKLRPDSAFYSFCENEKDWLEDYCLYMAVKKQFGQQSWSSWDDDIRLRDAEAIRRYSEMCAEDIDFWRFVQYEFMKQWSELKKYANDKGIEIIGDTPIYVAFDSADSWSSPELFMFSEDRVPLKVAGCPPDAFAADGQLWGNPLYDWDYHEKTGYAWWIKRIRHCFRLYDVVRVDHFRGFDEFYTIPFGSRTAAGGCWMQGPGMKLFSALKEALGDLPIIAEDLGYLTDSVEKLVHDTGYPGMKVLEFAFDSRESGDYMPYSYTHNCVAYTGTHDNQTLSAWYDELTEEDKKRAEIYLNLYGMDKKQIIWAFIRLTLSCTADLAVIPMQDYLCLGREARMNHPSTLGNNWTWRMKPGVFSKELRRHIYELCHVYGRC